MFIKKITGLKTNFVIFFFGVFLVFFYHFDVYDVIVTSHGNCWWLILADMDRGDQHLMITCNLDTN